MANERHLLTEIDEELLIAYCSVCETLVKIISTGKYKSDGSIYWRCKKAHRSASFKKNYPWKLAEKKVCEECGFVALVPAQLHIDHIDGNKKNNSPDNWMVLCANCHAYKTTMNADWKPSL